MPQTATLSARLLESLEAYHAELQTEYAILGARLCAPGQSDSMETAIAAARGKVRTEMNRVELDIYWLQGRLS